jgi:hypothetical protein
MRPDRPLTSQVTISGWSTDVERPVKGLFRLVDGMISAQMRTALVAHDPGWHVHQ